MLRACQTTPASFDCGVALMIVDASNSPMDTVAPWGGTFVVREDAARANVDARGAWAVAVALRAGAEIRS